MKEQSEKLLVKMANATGIFYPIASTLKAISDSKNSKIRLQQEYDEKYKREILDNAKMDGKRQIRRPLLNFAPPIGDACCSTQPAVLLTTA